MTVDKATELFESATIKSVPKIFLIHFGTNNLDHMSKQALSAKFLQFTSYLCKRFPCSKIIVSGLLPRRDWDSRESEDINCNIARKILDLPNAHFVPHDNTEEILNDKKHLNEQGFKIFLKNLKDCLLGRH